MKREEVQSLIVAALLMLVGGLTWLYGPWALVGCGAVLLVASFFIQVRED